jgi:hypothetical protein
MKEKRPDVLRNFGAALQTKITGAAIRAASDAIGDKLESS